MAVGNDVTDWWSTSIIDMAPGQVRLRGRPVEDVIGNMSFAEVIWLMTMGETPSTGQAALFEAALVAAVDHGPQAPSIATARMAVTCGLGLNGALGSAVNMLDDIHGGAGEQAVEVYRRVEAMAGPNQDVGAAVSDTLDALATEGVRFVPGFGHRFHKPRDPRAPRLLELVDKAAEDGVVSGRYATIGRTIEGELAARKGKSVPMNIDGATAVIYAELGVPAPLARGLFCLSRSVGIVAHAWEQMQQGGRNKGPTPPDYYWTYTGPNPIDRD